MKFQIRALAAWFKNIEKQRTGSVHIYRHSSQSATHRYILITVNIINIGDHMELMNELFPFQISSSWDFWCLIVSGYEILHHIWLQDTTITSQETVRKLQCQCVLSLLSLASLAVHLQSTTWRRPQMDVGIHCKGGRSLRLHGLD